MNTNTNPAAASESSSRDNPCYSRDPTVATLNVLADDERSYQLPYAQFLFSERTPNPALSSAPLPGFCPTIGGSGGGVGLACLMIGGSFLIRRRRGGLRQKPPLRIHAMRNGDSHTATR